MAHVCPSPRRPHSSASTLGGCSTRAHNVSCADDMTCACRPQRSEITPSGSPERSARCWRPTRQASTDSHRIPATLKRVLRLRVALVAAVLVACAGLALLLGRGGDDPPVVPTPPGGTRGGDITDPFAWTEERSAELSRRAAAGTSHLLYTRSPGGVAVTAERVLRYRRPIESAAKAAGVDPNRLEALVFLESAGRPEAQAPGGVQSAAGLTQILAETATGLL